MAKNEKQVVDVKKPSSTKPDIGSKPMIIGHKSLPSDPMVNNKPKVEEEKPVQKQKSPAVEKTNISPISEDMKAKNVKTEVKNEEVKKEPEKAIENPKESDSKNADVKKSAKKEPEIDPLAEQMERDDKLSKLIESKKYNLKIKQDRSWSIKTLVLVILGILISLLIAGYLLVDSGIIKSDINLPFRLIGEEEETTQQVIVPEIVTEEPKEVVEEKLDITENWFEYDNQYYTIKFPDGYILTSEFGAPHNIFASDIKYFEGEVAVVSVGELGPDQDVFRITYSVSTSGDICNLDESYKENSNFTTSNDLIIFKGVKEGSITAEEGGEGDLLVGETRYLYCIEDEQNNTLLVNYLHKENEVNEHENIEESIKTLVFKQS